MIRAIWLLSTIPLVVACGAHRGGDGGLPRIVSQGQATTLPAPAETFEPALASSNEEGWTRLTPGMNAATYYVSSSQGSDANAGTSEGSPFKTMEHAMALMKDGDWLLLRRGDVFGAIPGWRNGISGEFRSVIGAYGDLQEPRPLIDPEGEAGFMIAGGSDHPAQVRHLAVVGIHFKQSRNVPGSSQWTGEPSVEPGIAVLRPGSDILFEDVKVEGFGVGIAVQGEGEGLEDVVVRRSVIADCYALERVAHAEGIYASNAHRLRLEENVFDHNGFNENVAEAVRTIFNHNVYIDSNCTDPVLKDSIIARGASHGFQLRPSGIAEGNIVVANAIAGFVSEDNLRHDSVQVIHGNIVLHGTMGALGAKGSQGPRGWGLALLERAPGVASKMEFTDNIIAHGDPGASAAVAVEVKGAVVENNIVYKWGESDRRPFADPERTIATYQASIDGEPSIEAFLGQAREQRRGNWRSEYTASAIRAYFVEGFSLPQAPANVQRSPPESPARLQPQPNAFMLD